MQQLYPAINETDEKRKLIFEILDRINTRLTDAQDLLKYHTRSDAPQKGFKIRSPFNKRHADAQGVLDSDNGDEGERNRIRWAIKSKAKFEEVVTTLKTNYENLVRPRRELQFCNWEIGVEPMTRTCHRFCANED